MRALFITLLLSTANLLPAADFPMWRGDGSGAVPAPEEALVDSWQEVRVAWCSEAPAPHPWHYSVVRGHTQWPRTVLGNGGYCMPAIADGKVYVSYWRPAGEHHATDGDGKYPRKWVASGLPAYTLIQADQVIVCMDARTGVTLWEAVWELTELNMIEAYGGHNNLAIAEGKVVAIGNTGLAYCADATTGKKLWSVPVGPSHKQWLDFTQRCIAHKMKAYKIDSSGVPPIEKHPLGGGLANSTYNMCPVIVDGVAVVGEWSRGSGLAGLDLETGDERWRLDKVRTGVVPPLVWRHQNEDGKAGKGYIIKADSSINCWDPQTGTKLWSAGVLGNDGYNGATPAIKGDLLVAHGDWKDQNKDPATKGKFDQHEGWVCYRLKPDGAEKVWSLDAAYKGTMYIAPLIVDGHAWLPFQREPGTKGLTALSTSRNRHGFACVELASGKVVSESTDIQFTSVCPGPVAMGDMLFYINSKQALLAKLIPSGVKSLGWTGQMVNYCSSGSAADGLAFYRSGERLIVALDLRKPATRPQRRASTDPRNARFDLVLTGAQRSQQDMHVHLLSHDGACTQAWGTVPPRFNHPDPLSAGGLRLDGDKLDGLITAWPNGIYSEWELSCQIADGQVTGTYTDRYRGQEVGDTATGTMRARADQQADFWIVWHRDWWGGQNQGHEHAIRLSVRDGKVLEPVFEQRRKNHKPHFKVAITSNELQFADGTLTGTLGIDVECLHQNYIKEGACELDFALASRHNLVSGVVRSTYAGAKTRINHASGQITVPAELPVDHDDAVIRIELANSVTGKTPMTLILTSDGDRIAHATTDVYGCGGLHRTGASELRIVDGRLQGPVDITVQGDGYMIKNRHQCRYELDVALAGPDVTGTYTGIWDRREARSGAVSGTMTVP